MHSAVPKNSLLTEFTSAPTPKGQNHLVSSKRVSSRSIRPLQKHPLEHLFGIRKDTAVRVSLSSTQIAKEHENQPAPKRRRRSPPDPGRSPRTTPVQRNATPWVLKKPQGPKPTAARPS